MKEARLTLFLLLLSVTLLPARAANDDEAAADRITYLPGFPHELPSAHYSGYVTVGGGDEASGEARAPGARRLFYYLVESENNPERDPVVLWLNGGPGCSSFDAFVYENGPFLFGPSSSSSSNNNGDGGGADGLPTLTPNPFSWSKFATVIYLDSPGNVGLSYVEEQVDPSNNNSNKRGGGVFSTNDTATARDSDAFLRALLGERHPRFIGNEFAVAGESFAGIYVPMLTREIVRGNNAGKQPYINIRGYAIGNGCTDAMYDGNALPPFLAGRGLLPQDEYSELSKACNGSYWDAGGGWFLGREGQDGAAAAAAAAVEGKAKDECARLLDRSMRVLKGVNIYDVLDLCHASHRPQADEEDSLPSLLRRPWAAATLSASSSSSFSFSPDARVAALQPSARVSAPPSSPPSRGARAPLLGHDPPCTSSSLADAWLNDDRVRRALHATPVDEPGGAGRWTLCSDRIDYTHDAGSMLPVHAELLPGLPGWPGMLARAGLHREAAAAAAAAAAANARAGVDDGGGKRSNALRALVYSGDHDAAVPSTGSEAWTRDMGGGKALRGRGWRRWMVEGGTDAGGRPADGEDAAGGERGGGGAMSSSPRSQVAGFTVSYEGGLTYATVRGAGHMVPTSKPLEALELFRRFVQGEDLAPPDKEEEEGGEGEAEGEEERRPSASASASF